MRIAIIGSRRAGGNLAGLILKELPPHVSEIVSGGAEGVDSAAAQAAEILSLPLTVFRPDYSRYGRRAPLIRNTRLISYADEVLAFWDGESRGTRFAIAECIRLGRPVRVIPLPPASGRLAFPHKT